MSVLPRPEQAREIAEAIAWAAWQGHGRRIDAGGIDDLERAVAEEIARARAAEAIREEMARQVAPVRAAYAKALEKAIAAIGRR